MDVDGSSDPRPYVDSGLLFVSLRSRTVRLSSPKVCVLFPTVKNLSPLRHPPTQNSNPGFETIKKDGVPDPFQSKIPFPTCLSSLSSLCLRCLIHPGSLSSLQEVVDRKLVSSVTKLRFYLILPRFPLPRSTNLHLFSSFCDMVVLLLLKSKNLKEIKHVT